MHALDLYRDLQRAGLELSTDGDKLFITHADRLTDELRANIRQHKQELIDRLLHVQAANDSTPTDCCTPAPASPAAAPEPTDWLVLDRAYQAHHFNCAVCIAAGRGVRYGLRCGVGAALWTAYTDAARAQPPPWEKRRK